MPPWNAGPPKKGHGLLIGLVSGGAALLVLIVIGVVVIVRVGSGDGAPTHRKPAAGVVEGGSLTSAFDARGATSLLPYDAVSPDTYAISRALFTGLVAYDGKTGKPVNRIASRVSTDDRKSWTITLRHGWTFDNGEPVDAAAFVRGWNYAANGRNNAAAGYELGHIEGYDAVQSGSSRQMSGLSAPDRYTLKVTLTEPYLWFRYQLGEPVFAPMAKACLEDVESCKTHPIGDGPFAVHGDWTQGSDLVLTRSGSYQGRKAHLTTLTLKPVSEPAVAVAALKSGRIDLLPSVPPDQYADAAQAHVTTVHHPSLSMVYLGVAGSEKRFKDPRFRRALSEALNRSDLVRVAGAGSPATSFVPSGVAGAPADDSCGGCVSNVGDAKKLLSAAGVDSGAQMPVYTVEGSTSQQVVAAACAQWRQSLGLRCSIHVLPASAYYQLIAKHELSGAYRMPWVGASPTAGDYLDGLFATGGTSFAYSNRSVDAAIAEGDGAASAAAAAKAYGPVWEALDKDMPAIPLYRGEDAALVGDGFTGVALGPLGAVDYAAISRTR